MRQLKLLQFGALRCVAVNNNFDEEFNFITMYAHRQLNQITHDRLISGDFM